MAKQETEASNSSGEHLGIALQQRWSTVQAVPFLQVVSVVHRRAMELDDVLFAGSYFNGSCSREPYPSFKSWERECSDLKAPRRRRPLQHP